MERLKNKKKYTYEKAKNQKNNKFKTIKAKNIHENQITKLTKQKHK